MEKLFFIDDATSFIAVFVKLHPRYRTGVTNFRLKNKNTKGLLIFLYHPT